MSISSPLFAREVADTENSKFNSSCANKYLTIVVFPEPEGAENTISLPGWFVLEDIE